MNTTNQLDELAQLAFKQYYNLLLLNSISELNAIRIKKAISEVMNATNTNNINGKPSIFNN